MVEGPMRFGWGTMVSEIMIIGLLFALTWVLVFILANSIVQKNADDLQDLDERLAMVVKELIENLMQMSGDIEQPNPVQLMIAEFIRSKIESPIKDVAVITARDSKGRISP